MEERVYSGERLDPQELADALIETERHKMAFRDLNERYKALEAEYAGLKIIHNETHS